MEVTCRPYFCRTPVAVIKERHPGFVHQIGGWKIIGWGSELSQEKSGLSCPTVLSPLHGRSATIFHPNYGNISIKGVGWTLGPIKAYPSPKDKQLYFGLYSLKDGLREFAVSEYLELQKVEATCVHGLATFTPDFGCHETFYQDGAPVEPSLLYVKSKSPWRVADLPWLPQQSRAGVISDICNLRGWNQDEFVRDFCEHLSKTMARYHQLGCINDSLSADNVTLAGEITDFEWFMAPGHPLPDGSQFEDAPIRRRKEALYAYEIGCLLAHATGRPADLIKIIPALIKGYQGGDAECSDELSRLNKTVSSGDFNHGNLNQASMCFAAAQSGEVVPNPAVAPGSTSHYRLAR